MCGERFFQLNGCYLTEKSLNAKVAAPSLAGAGRCAAVLNTFCSENRFSLFAELSADDSDGVHDGDYSTAAAVLGAAEQAAEEAGRPTLRRRLLRRRVAVRRAIVQPHRRLHGENDKVMFH